MNFLKLITRRTSRQCLNDLPEQYGNRYLFYFEQKKTKEFFSIFLERVIGLQFSQLERTYYDRVWNECRDEFKREFHHLWQKRERERNGNSFRISHEKHRYDPSSSSLNRRENIGHFNVESSSSFEVYCFSLDLSL
jgi:hypothetical protein